MDEKDVKNVENKTGNPIRTYPRVDARHACYKILVENGIDKRQAALILGYKPKSAYEIEKRLEKKGQRIEVTTQKMVRKSVRNLEKLVDAQPFGTLESVKDSVVLAAIQTILDRSHPKRQENSPPVYTFTAVNLDFCKPDHPSYNGDLIRPDNDSPVEPAGGDVVPISPDEKSGSEEKS